MKTLFTELRWLPTVPENFGILLKALETSSGPIGRNIQFLATHRLDLNQLTRLARAIGKAKSEGKQLEPLVQFKLAVVSNSTIDLIVPARVASAARYGIALDVIQPSYDQLAQESLTQNSRANNA